MPNHWLFSLYEVLYTLTNSNAVSGNLNFDPVQEMVFEMRLTVSRIALFSLVFCVFLSIPKGPVMGNHLPTPVSSQFKGMTLIAIPVEKGESFDVPVIASGDALERLRQAILVLMARSPTNAGFITRLKARGPVYIVYDPHYPNTRAYPATLKVAMFLPKYLPAKANNSAGSVDKEFLVVVGRHGIKWPAADLAAVLVHELVGHGMQHLTDSRFEMRQMDVECEAWLYQEQAHQDFGLDKLSPEMIRFQQQLAFNCHEFIDFLGRTDTPARQQWRRLNPDVPALLDKFSDYLEELRAQGAVAKTKAFAKARRDEKRSRIYREGPSSEIRRIGDLYLYGMGAVQDYGVAAKWYARAANLGCAAAQLRLATLYLDGIGVEKNLQQAYFWLNIIIQGDDPHLLEKSITLSKIAVKDMTPDQVDLVDKRVGDASLASQTCD